MQCFQKNGVAKDKIVVSVPATKNGVHATRFLSKEDGILVNLTMVAGMLHAAVCAEAGAAWVTFNLDGVSLHIIFVRFLKLIPRICTVAGEDVPASRRALARDQSNPKHDCSFRLAQCRDQDYGQRIP